MKNNGQNNAIAKVVALICATILWLYVMNEQNPPKESSYTVPLEIRNVAQDVVVMKKPEFVRVKVRAPRTVIAAVEVKDIKPSVDASTLAEGQHLLSVQVALPPSVEFIEVVPEQAGIEIEALLQQTMSVALHLSGAPAIGQVVGEPSAEPKQVRIQGPRSLVNKVNAVLAIVDIAGKDQDVSGTVAVKAVDKEGRTVSNVTVSPATVTVKAPISPLPDHKQVTVKPVTYGNLVNGFTLSQLKVVPDTVKLQGDPLLLERIDFVYTEPVNVTGLDSSLIKPMPLQLQAGVTATPNTVEVTVEVTANTR